jgi:hypothetical protein
LRGVGDLPGGDLDASGAHRSGVTFPLPRPRGHAPGANLAPPSPAGFALFSRAATLDRCPTADHPACLHLRHSGLLLARLSGVDGVISGDLRVLVRYRSVVFT